jgi:putative hemolysin
VGELPADAAEAGGPFIQRADGSWLVDGSASMEALATRFDLPPLPEDESGAYHTVGGFVMARLGRVPECADTFEWGGLQFEIVDMDGRRVDKVMVTRVPPHDLEEANAATVDAER